MVRREYIVYIWTIETGVYPNKKTGYKWELKSKHAHIRCTNVFPKRCGAIAAVDNYTTKHQIGTKGWHFPGTDDIELGWEG